MVLSLSKSQNSVWPNFLQKPNGKSKKTFSSVYKTIIVCTDWLIVLMRAKECSKGPGGGEGGGWFL